MIVLFPFQLSHKILILAFKSHSLWLITDKAIEKRGTTKKVYLLWNFYKAVNQVVFCMCNIQYKKVAVTLEERERERNSSHGCITGQLIFQSFGTLWPSLDCSCDRKSISLFHFIVIMCNSLIPVFLWCSAECPSDGGGSSDDTARSGWYEDS